MIKNKYMPRILDSLLKEYLTIFGGVLIVGPKWCGKTTTAEQNARSVLKLQDPSTSLEYRKMAESAPAFLLKGNNPRLIDEWQTIPLLWDAVRSAIDDRGEPGQFILTGSAVPKDDGMMHTGTGRIARLHMYPMSLFESGDSSGSISLQALFDGNALVNGQVSNLTIEGLAHVICRGGWPGVIKMNEHASSFVVTNYLESVCESDVSRVLGSVKKPNVIRAILRAYARNLSTMATQKTIMDDVSANEGSISAPTFGAYLDALKRIFVIEDVPAWSPAIRSKTAIRSKDKIEFVDPSLAAAALGISSAGLLNDLNTMGFFFESLVVRDLRVYSQSLGGQISYYHDRYGLECDVVLHLRDGRYALIEVKTGSREIEEGASHLRELQKLIIEHHMKAPDILMVITGGKLAYKREDGVFVIPLACLKD